MTKTPSIERIVEAVTKEYPLVASLGIYNRRYKRGRFEWSQHAWGNAWDITYPSTMDQTEGRAYLDRVYAFLAARRATKALPIHWIIWRKKNHYDHIHVVGEPKQTGTPPLSGKANDMESEAVKMIQRGLNKTGYVDGHGRPLKVDGKVGPNTEFAFNSFLSDKPSLKGTRFSGVIE